jgi:acetoin:2,6-dichlorophenolindophenol oxidoreductase subunit alpha
MTQDQQLETYRRMQRIRQFEQAGSKLYQAGKIPGAYHASIGQEAAIVGACMALRDDDYIVGTHRSHGHPIGKGAKLHGLMAELMGKATGICKGRGGSMHLADCSVGILGESAIVGGGIPLAAGAAKSAKVRKSTQVSLGFFGDGASNQGTFHETLNMASLWNLPVIFFCENNGYAITTSLKASHAQPVIAKHAEAYDIPGISVDGQDVIAVYEAASAAVARARAGEGPTLIEAQTYRFDDHQIGLSALVTEPYRPASEVESYMQNRDPIVIYRRALSKAGISGAELDAIEKEVADAVAHAIAFAEESPEPAVTEVYKHMYVNPIHYPPSQARINTGTLS